MPGTPRRSRTYFNHIGSRLSTETLVVAALSIVLGAHFNHIGSRLSTETAIA